MAYVAWSISFLASGAGLVFTAGNLIALSQKQAIGGDPAECMLVAVVSAIAFAVSWDQMKARWG